MPFFNSQHLFKNCQLILEKMFAGGRHAMAEVRFEVKIVCYHTHSLLPSPRHSSCHSNTQ